MDRTLRGIGRVPLTSLVAFGAISPIACVTGSVLDGDGDGVSAVDPGAYEFEPSPP